MANLQPEETLLAATMDDSIYTDGYYDSIAESWNKLSYGSITRALAEDRRLAPGGQRVLDIGCGIGLYCRALAKEGNCYLGVDVSAPALRIASERGVPVLFGEAEQLPLPPASVDYVFSTEVIEHVASPELMMGEIYRVLKPGGCGLITTTTYQFIIFHYLWVLSEIGFRLGELVSYPLGYFSKRHRDRFVRLLYEFTGGHLWGFLKRDLLRLVHGSHLQVDDLFFLNVQPLIPLKLQGGGVRQLLRKAVSFLNGYFLHKSRAFYGPNIVVLFRKPAG
jgi:ubiquinone/menaquinone biosynthesis C-methylase UbiE